MRNLKKLVACFALMFALVVTSVTSFAADSPSGQKFGDVSFKSDVTAYTYNTFQKKPTVTVLGADGKALVKGTDYKVTYKNNVAAGTATAIITGIGAYAGQTKELTYSIAKAYPRAYINKGGATKRTLTPLKTKDRNLGRIKFYVMNGSKYKLLDETMNVTYSSSDSKNVKVDKNGNVTVAKKAKKGTYTITIKIKASSNFRGTTRKTTVVVK